jgi:hypothetical protein
VVNGLPRFALNVPFNNSGEERRPGLEATCQGPRGARAAAQNERRRPHTRHRGGSDHVEVTDEFCRGHLDEERDDGGSHVTASGHMWN